MKPVRAAAYARVSTQMQSTELQRSEIVRYIESRGFELFEVYEDEGHTGTHTRRPAFQKMMKAAFERRFDVLVVWKLDRVARSLKDLIQTLDSLQARSIEFISIRDQIDAHSPMGKAFIQILGVLAELEGSLIRERVKSGLEHARSKGVQLGRPRKRTSLEIKALRAQGMSCRAIARELGIGVSSVVRGLKR